MKKEHLEFIEKHIANFDTARLGFVKNIDKSTLVEYETIYKEYINDKFVLTYWCSGCVLSMMKDLIKYYDNNAKPDTQENINLEFADRKQKTKKKKDING